MKYLTFLMLMMFAIGCNEATKTASSDTAATTSAPASDKADEDCDEKAKMPIEIKEDSISLSGDTGCSLDDANNRPL
jgi:heat shock protein HslJ